MAPNKTWILSLLITLLTSLCVAQISKPCFSLKNRTFKSVLESDNLVTLTDSTHYEEFNNGKYFLKSTVIWNSNCEYTATLQEHNIPNFSFKPGTILNAKLVEKRQDTIYLDVTIHGRTDRYRYVLLQ